MSYNLTGQPPCSASSNCTFPNLCSTVCANDDLVSLGIRINFYTTILLFALIPETRSTKELLEVLSANTEITSLGLLVTAIRQTFAHKLSLFHALCLHHILFFLGVGIGTVGKYKWSRSRIAFGFVTQYLLFAAFISWELYLWANIKHFGSQPYLNDKVKYVLLFVKINATASGLRRAWIAAAVISALVLTISFGVFVFALFTKRRHDEADEGDGTQYFSIDISSDWQSDIELFPIAFAIYSIVMLELMIKRNSTQHNGVVEVDNKWTFGQILSVVIVFANFNEIIRFLFRKSLRRERSS